MSNLRGLIPTAVLAVLLVRSPLRAEEQTPQELPTRDVDISYQITRPQQPTITQRRRWLASERLVRTDGLEKSATIYDRNAHEITMLNTANCQSAFKFCTPNDTANRTYLKLEGAPRLPLDPEKGRSLKRGGESVVAGLHCVDWSWREDVETHTICLTPDEVLLRLVVDGKTLMQALSVTTHGSRPNFFGCRRAIRRPLRREAIRGFERPYREVSLRLGARKTQRPIRASCRTSRSLTRCEAGTSC
jgi:hypothetical protein